MGDPFEPDEVQFGLLPSPPDWRDWNLDSVLAAGEVTLPTKYVTGPWPILNQFSHAETVSMCVAFSGVAVRTSTEKMAENADVRFDPPELYYRCKELDGVPNQPGTYIRVAADVLKDRGAKVTTLNGTVPAQTTYLPIEAYIRLDETNGTEIKTAIKTYGAAWVAMKWYKNWNRSGGLTGVSTFPKPGTFTTNHAVMFVGWDDNFTTQAGKGAFLVQNSGGKSWGINGVAWLPYQYLGQLNEAWQTIDKLDIQPPIALPVQGGTVQLVNWRLDEVADLPLGKPIFDLNEKLLKNTTTVWGGKRVLAQTPDNKYTAFLHTLNAERVVVLALTSDVTNVRKTATVEELQAKLEAAKQNASATIAL